MSAAVTRSGASQPTPKSEDPEGPPTSAPSEAGKPRGYALPPFSALDYRAATEEGGARHDAAAARAQAEAEKKRPPIESSAEAVEIVRAHFGEIEALGTDGKGQGAGDGMITTDELLRAASDENLPPEVQEACGWLANDRVLRDLVDNAAYGNPRDGLFIEADFAAYGHAAEPPPEMTAKKAAEILRDNFDALEAIGKDGKGDASGDGLFGMPELQAAQNSSGLSDEVKAAAKYFIDHPADLRVLDGADDGGHVDGRVSHSDCEAYASIASDQPEGDVKTDSGQTPKQALQLILDNLSLVERTAAPWFGGMGMGMGWGMIGDSRSLSMDDLKTAANNPSLSKELRDACKFLAENEKYRNLVDGAGPSTGFIQGSDGRFSRRSLEEIIPLLP